MVEILEVESFALFNGLESSILNLNPIIQKDGYEFVEFSLEDFENEFYGIINIPYELVDLRRKEKAKEKIPLIFHHLEYFLNPLRELIKLVPPNFDVDFDISIFLLKKTINHTIEHGPSYYLRTTCDLNVIGEYSKNLLKKLRLYQKGTISLQAYFTKIKKKNHIVDIRKTGLLPQWGKYIVNKEELQDITKFVNYDIDSLPSFLKLALDNFELAHNQLDVRLKFLLFTTTLECLYNIQKTDPIRHVISRHLALTIMQSADDFDLIQKEMKSLYDLRSKIVHGGEISKDKKPSDSVIILEEYTRKALKEIINFYFGNICQSKDDLFKYLNKKGVV